MAKWRDCWAQENCRATPLVELESNPSCAIIFHSEEICEQHQLRSAWNNRLEEAGEISTPKPSTVATLSSELSHPTRNEYLFEIPFRSIHTLIHLWVKWGSHCVRRVAREIKLRLYVVNTIFQGVSRLGGMGWNFVELFPFGGADIKHFWHHGNFALFSLQK